MFDFAQVLKIIKNLKLKGYNLLKQKNSYGHYPYLENFFIFQKEKKSEYLRLILMSNGWNSEQVFYWNVEFSFKPNHRAGAKWESEQFKGTAEDLYLSRFLEAIEQIKLYIESQLID